MCSFKCGLKHNLNRHVRQVHENKKLHTKIQCPQCDSSFIQKSDLKRHVLAVHEGKKPFKCLQCKSRFTQSYHLKAHVLAVHEGINSSIIRKEDEETQFEDFDKENPAMFCEPELHEYDLE